jgi:hypothetical protein
VLDKGVNLGVLHYHVLECVAHITCQSTVSISHCGRGGVARRGPHNTHRSG